MTTFWEIAAHSVGHLYSFYCVFLYIFFHFGFKSGIWLFIAPVSVHCFSITLTQENENGEVCIEKQRRSLDEISLKCVQILCGRKSVGNDNVDYLLLGECHRNARARGDQPAGFRR